jgi:UDP-glucose 4-epimerase
MPKRILVVGAAGFIGSSLVYSLLNRGYEVAILTRSSSNLFRIEQVLHKVVHIVGDLNNVNSYAQAVSDFSPHIWFQCAWTGIKSEERNQFYQFSDNIPATIKAYDLAQCIGVKRWVGLGSQAEYGIANCRVNEDYICKPITNYGKAKLFLSQLLVTMGKTCKTETVWLRVFDVFGPNDNDNWILPYCIKKALTGETAKLTGCEQMWDFLYIDDLCEAMINCIEVNSLAGVFNVGSGSPVLIKDAVEFIFSTTGRGTYELGAIEYSANQIMHLEADISKIYTATGWYPKVNFFDGLSITIDYIRTALRHLQ